MKGTLFIDQRASKRTGKEYRAVWLAPESGSPCRLVSLDWFKFACVFKVFDKIKAGDYPIFLCDFDEVNE